VSFKRLHTFLLFVCITLMTLTCKKEPPVVPTSSGQDTTSHNFTWAQYTFGGPNGSSGFKDVAIVSDSDIWAVGSIYTAPDTMYNAVHWDGKRWELLQIQFYTFCGQTHTGSYPIDAVLALNESEVWFTSNSQITIWKNNGQQNIVCLPISVNKIWTEAGNTIYTVGPNGEIGFNNGTNWTSMPSGTTIDLRDVWGSSDGKTIWACGFSDDDSQSILLKYTGSSWETVWSRGGTSFVSPYGYFVTSLWGTNSLILSSGRGVFQDTTQVVTLPWFPYRIRGSANNNIAVAGDNGMIWHWNGADWKQLNTQSGQPLYSLAVSQTMIAAVGSDFNIGLGAALIYLGKRYSN